MHVAQISAATSCCSLPQQSVCRAECILVPTQQQCRACLPSSCPLQLPFQSILASLPAHCERHFQVAPDALVHCLLGSAAENVNGGVPVKRESSAWSVEELLAGAPKSMRTGDPSETCSPSRQFDCHIPASRLQLHAQGSGLQKADGESPCMSRCG